MINNLGVSHQHEPMNVPQGYDNHIRSLSRGEVLYLEGDRPEAMYRLKEGLLRMTRIKPDGRNVTLRHILPGDLFGEEAVIDANRFADTQALTDAQIEIVDHRNVEHDASEVLASIVDQTQRLMNDEYDVQVGALQSRVARYLCRLQETPLASLDEAGRWRISATHELIAEGTGSTRESVSKELSELRHAGLISTGYRNIVLLDLDGLDEIAEDVF